MAVREQQHERYGDGYLGGSAAGRSPSGDGFGRSGWATALVALVVIAFGAWVVWALVDDDSAGPDTGVTLNEIADEPGQHIGRTVTISGEVESVEPDGLVGGDASVRPRAFAIGGDALGEQVLVVPSGGLTAAGVDEGDIVQVTGTVRRFSAEEFQDDFDIDFGAGLFGDFEARPAIVAAAIDPTVPTGDEQ